MRKEIKYKHQQIVKFMRRMNKSIAADEFIGLNRFRIDMYSADWHRYADGSGYYGLILFKISDAETGNWAIFAANNYNYENKLHMYANDFLIRCSSGNMGHLPPLTYIAYDVRTIKKYAGEKSPRKIIDKVIDTYNWLK